MSAPASTTVTVAEATAVTVESTTETSSSMQVDSNEAATAQVATTRRRSTRCTTTVTAAAAVSESTVAAKVSAPKRKKAATPKNASVAPVEEAELEEADAADAEQPAKKKGRASNSKKKNNTDTPTASQEGVEEEADSSPAVSTATLISDLLSLESQKRSSLPAGSHTICCWNVNGLRAAIKNGAERYLLQKQPDIIALCEVKADEEVIKKEFGSFLYEQGGEGEGEGKKKKKKLSPIAAAFAGQAPSKPTTPYPHRYFNCCTNKKGYSGTALFSKIEPLSVKYGLEGVDAAADEAAEEGRVITAEFADYYLVLTYVPNAGQKLERLSYRTEQWDSALLSHLQTLQHSKPVVWTGDLNVAHHDIDIHNPKTNTKSAGFTKEERTNFDQLVKLHGFVDVFHQLYPEEKRRFTYWGHRFNGRSTNKGWRLDYFVCSPSLTSRVLDTWIGSELSEGDKGVRMSDHAPIFLALK